MSVISGISKCYSYCVTILIGLCFFHDGMSQATGDPQEDFLYGEYYISLNEYQEALPFFLSSLLDNPENSNINYRVGLCYLKIIGEQQEALPYLEKAVKNIDEHYVEGKYKDPAAPVEAWLLLGDAYHRENELLKASYAYHKYKKYIENSDKQKLEIVTKKINGLGISSEYQRFEHDVRIVNLGNIINSRFSDYNPVLSGDQSILVYTQFWETYDQIMITQRTVEGWDVPKPINDQIGSTGNCYSSALSYDGTELYLIWHYALDYDVYVSHFENGVWTQMVPVPGKVNSRYRESSVSISSDDKFLYFSSDRPGGEGGFDIYRAERTGDDEWTNVINLGKNINTDKNEEAPYITFDGTFLFLSSNGHETIGNMDILYSEQDSSGNWKPPVNVGSPVNTTKDDIFYVYFPETQTGYLARDLPEGYGKNDLYRVQTGNDPQFISEETSSDTFISLQYDEVSSELINPPDAVHKNTGISNSDSYQNNDTPEVLPQEFPYGYVPDYSLPVDSIPTYTIQLYALRNRMDPKRIKLGEVAISEGNDSLYRYTYGKYIGYSKALEQLDSLRKSGFPDAFIRNIETLNNLSYDDDR